MSRLLSDGLVPASAIAGEPDGYCALCGGSIDARARVHIQTMRAVCRHCLEADGHDTARVAARLAALDEQERRAHELRTAEPVRVADLGDRALRGRFSS